MTVWIMQAGPRGAFADFIQDTDMLTIGWENFESFADCQDPQQIFDRIRPETEHKKQEWSGITLRKSGGSFAR